MAKQYTGDELVKLVHDSAMIPDVGAKGFTEEDILGHLTYCLHTDILPEIMKFKEEFFLVRERLSITNAKTRIPSRAVGNRVRDVFLRSGGNSYPLVHMDRGELSCIGDGSGDPSGFYMEGNHIVVHPESSTPSGELDVTYYFSPGDIQLLANCRKVDSVSDGKVFWDDVQDKPSGWDGNQKYDIHAGDSGGEIHAWDLEPTDTGTSFIKFSTAEIDGSRFGRFPVAKGDYLCLAGEAALPGIPKEAQPTLAQSAICRLLLALGDHENFNVQVQKLNKMISDFERLFNARVEGRPKIINNRRGVFSGRGRRRGANMFGGF